MTPDRDQRIDTHIFWTTMALCLIGIVMVYSSSAIFTAMKQGDGFFYLKRQLLWFCAGMTGLVVAMRVNYQFLRRIAGIVIIGSTLMLLAVLIPGLGHTVGGATRWVKLIGFSVQPAEMAKIGLVIFLAHSLAKKQKEQLTSFKVGIVPYAILLAILLFLLLMQPDFGSSMIMGLVCVGMLLVAGSRIRHFLLAVPVLAPIFYWLVMSVDYRRKRVLAFLNPDEDPLGANFQLNQSLTAFGSGGWFGQGLGGSNQKLFFLPEAHTDFIFSVIGEEFGYMGVAVVATLFLYLLARGIRAALRAPDQFGCFLGFGLVMLLGIEAFCNMAVTLGLFPTKGLALPFISYGGSSLVSKMILVGILLNISIPREEVPR